MRDKSISEKSGCTVYVKRVTQWLEVYKKILHMMFTCDYVEKSVFVPNYVFAESTNSKLMNK